VTFFLLQFGEPDAQLTCCGHHAWAVTTKAKQLTPGLLSAVYCLVSTFFLPLSDLTVLFLSAVCRVLYAVCPAKYFKCAQDRRQYPKIPQDRVKGTSKQEHEHYRP
jgi:hypothetical protein